MKLFLASEARNEIALEKLKDFIGGSFENKKIAYIPTAQNGKYYGAWKREDCVGEVLALGANTKIIELESCSYKNIVDEIYGSDIIWFEGGMPSYLLYWIRRSELDKKLPEMLNQGTVYVGSSAGTMICSKTMHLTEHYIGESEPGGSLLPGLGYVDFEIYPHYTDDLKSQIEKIWPNKLGKLYLLKDGDAITKVGDKIEVLGEELIIGS